MGGNKTSLTKKRALDLGPTEKENPSFRQVDSFSAWQIARLINEEDQKVAKAIRSQLKPIGQAIEMVRESLSQGGRLFYVGAGTSGRLGVLDAAECPPTFGVRATMVQGIIAGGKRALWRAVEGAEDDREAGARAVRKASLRHRDIVCGITASGQTPFVRGALAESRKIGARSILITSHPNPALGPWGDIVIKAVVGPEVIAGSTRMKAGTATKMILNMISTGTMVRMGKVLGNLMVDLQPTSKKLGDRALRIITAVLGCSREQARKLFHSSQGQTKVAIVMGVRNIGRKEAENWIAEKRGSLREILPKG